MSKTYVKMLVPYHKMNTHSIYEVRSEGRDHYIMKNGVKVPKNLVTFNIQEKEKYSEDYWEGDFV